MISGRRAASAAASGADNNSQPPIGTVDLNVRRQIAPQRTSQQEGRPAKAQEGAVSVSVALLHKGLNKRGT
jgi:hypothetical protein